MEYRCISADSHIDIAYLPHELFVSNASAAMKPRMPRVVDGPNGPMWVTREGQRICYANGSGAAATAGAGILTRYVPGKSHRFDRMAAVGFFSDIEKGLLHPSDPALRLQDQDRDGIQAEVLYGLLSSGEAMADPQATIEFYRIYNDWLADFCSYDPSRLIGLACLPYHDVQAAVAEAHRAARIGLRGLDIMVSHEMTPLWNPHWDPLWKAAAETGLPVHFHTISPPREAPLAKDAPPSFVLMNKAARHAGFQMYCATVLSGVIYGGALERFPQLRVVLGESGIGWIPYVIQRMDDQFSERFNTGLPLKLKPSEYWRRQCRATFQDDMVGIALLDKLGVETVMWANDYPHGDSIFPDSQEFIERQFSGLPAGVRRKVTCENAGRFYGLM